MVSELITDRLRRELIHRAAAESPQEACGLIGSSGDGLVLYAAENAAESPTDSFLIAPEEQLGILKRMKEAEHRLVGLYHSHPRSAPEPSARDREIAKLWPGLTWVIVGLEGALPALWVGSLP